MNNKIKRVIIPLLACIFLAPFALLRYERNKIAQLKYENFKLENNIAALNDTVRITKDKNNELEFNRRSFITDKIQELEALSTSLAAEVKATKGKVITITKAGTKIILHDTIQGTVDTFHTGTDSGFIVGLNLDTIYSPGNTRRLEGYVKVSAKAASADIKEEIGISAITGLKKNEKGDYEIFFRSKYPNLTITSLEGSYIPKNQLTPPVKKKHFGFGLNVSYSPLAYKFDQKKLKIENQLTAGVGIIYKF